MRDLNARDDAATRCLGMLGLFAEVYRISGTNQRFPALTAWLAALMTPVIESFHNRAERKRLESEVERLGGRGDIQSLFGVISDGGARQRDAAGFAEARQEYAELADTIDWLSRGGLASRERVTNISHQASTLVSAVIAGLTTLALTILFVV